MYFAGQAQRTGIVSVQDGDIIYMLVLEDVRFGGSVGSHSFMSIQMVGGDVEYHRDMRGNIHQFQLEAGKFNYSPIFGLNIFQVLDQWESDIPADPGIPWGSQLGFGNLTA